MPGLQGLIRPLSLDAIQDGGLYSPPSDFSPEQTNLFFHVGRVDHVYIKIPTDRAWHDYHAFIRDGQVTAEDVRPLEAAERPPAGGTDAGAEADAAHFLTILRLQYDRLRTSGLIAIPDARFAFLRVQGPGGLEPAVFQLRVPGATLWDMFDFDALRIRPAWQAHRPTIAAQLASLVDSALAPHIDWNIRNFIFHGAEQRLYYVDAKPTLFVARASNDLNLSGIRTYFLS